jgi:hypothetical protein
MVPINGKELAEALGVAPVVHLTLEWIVRLIVPLVSSRARARVDMPAWTRPPALTSKRMIPTTMAYDQGKPAGLLFRDEHAIGPVQVIFPDEGTGARIDGLQPYGVLAASRDHLFAIELKSSENGSGLTTLSNIRLPVWARNEPMTIDSNGTEDRLFKAESYQSARA